MDNEGTQHSSNFPLFSYQNGGSMIS
uniref:Uncharacterized protein n=1 Tax=Lepeophtheirus salmonis TaxID=72036 RepID=A0A0K2UGU4_LEPSM